MLLAPQFSSGYAGAITIGTSLQAPTVALPQSQQVESPARPAARRRHAWIVDKHLRISLASSTRSMAVSDVVNNACLRLGRSQCQINGKGAYVNCGESRPDQCAVSRRHRGLWRHRHNAAGTSPAASTHCNRFSRAIHTSTICEPCDGDGVVINGTGAARTLSQPLRPKPATSWNSMARDLVLRRKPSRQVWSSRVLAADNSVTVSEVERNVSGQDLWGRGST
jgi:hypothetical protein